ncbi:uncharacterized protein LOC124449134 [Xenia sp. Carnegie-2017]|uniref:uncharacterized protein LOC124449134 n=1 Tax=Xenia sp. Carnegie-2017 TaxID=2897299 RepID=UPI001F0333C5|nr:uncharacterized protein LOC124449134 [Xenia sp. Carnegie-2017]
MMSLFFLNIALVIARNCPRCSIFGESLNITEIFPRLEKKEVRIVYFNLNVASNTTRQNRILSRRWTWAKSNQEPLLALSYDHDVLSLGLLKNQAKELNLEITSREERICLERLNSTCHDQEIARYVLNKVGEAKHRTAISENDVRSLTSCMLCEFPRWTWR